MSEYHLLYRWDLTHAIPQLTITVTGKLLVDPLAVAAMLDTVHAYVDRRVQYTAVHIVYDITRTERKLPLLALMRRQYVSPKVAAVTIIGAQSRKDEMAVLIMASAKKLSYPITFAPAREAARSGHPRSAHLL